MDTYSLNLAIGRKVTNGVLHSTIHPLLQRVNVGSISGAFGEVSGAVVTPIVALPPVIASDNSENYGLEITPVEQIEEEPPIDETEGDAQGRQA